MARSRFKYEQSPAYVRAVAALRDLLIEEDVDAVRRAFAEATHEDIKMLFTQRYKLKASMARGCIHRVMGKRCPRLPNDEEDCPQIPGGDHLSVWQRQDKTYLLVSQPYNVSYNVLKETVEFCEAYGLEVDLSAFPSWHFPSATVGIIYTTKKGGLTPPS